MHCSHITQIKIKSCSQHAILKVKFNLSMLFVSAPSFSDSQHSFRKGSAKQTWINLPCLHSCKVYYASPLVQPAFTTANGRLCPCCHTHLLVCHQICWELTVIMESECFVCVWVFPIKEVQEIGRADHASLKTVPILVTGLLCTLLLFSPLSGASRAGLQGAGGEELV